MRALQVITCVEIFTPKKCDVLAMILVRKSLAFIVGRFGFVFFVLFTTFSA